MSEVALFYLDVGRKVIVAVLWVVAIWLGLGLLAALVVGRVIAANDHEVVPGPDDDVEGAEGDR